MREALHVPGLTATERLVLAEFAEFSSPKRGLVVWRSRADLVAKTGANPQTIQRAISRMRDLGYLSVAVKARKGKSLTVELHPDRWPTPPPRAPAGDSSRRSESHPQDDDHPLWADTMADAFPEVTSLPPSKWGAPPDECEPPPMARGSPPDGKG